MNLTININPRPRGSYRPALTVLLGLLASSVALAQSVPPEVSPALPQTRTTKSRPTANLPKKDFTLVVESRAMDLLRGASERLAAAKSMSFTANVSYEYPSRLGPPIVYPLRYDVTMQRPDKLRVLTLGAGPTSEFYYDGKTMVAYAPAEDLVAVADAPPTIDAALKAAYDLGAIYYPFTDLIVGDPFAALAEGTTLAFYVGQSGAVGGTTTDMVVWANKDVFLQIWIGVDDKLPRRLRAIYTADPLQLRHDMELSDWQIDPAIAPDAFSSQKAQSGKPIAFASPVATPAPRVQPPARSSTQQAKTPASRAKSP